jgi:hypothetical protein
VDGGRLAAAEEAHRGGLEVDADGAAAAGQGGGQAEGEGAKREVAHGGRW